MHDLKFLVNKIKKSLPTNDPMQIGDLVHKDDIKKEIEELKKTEASLGPKLALIKSMSEFRRGTDLLNAFTLDAMKQTIYEMHFAKTSTDRLRAAENLLNRGMGKPADKLINVNVDVGQYHDEDLKSRISHLLSELGYSNENTRKLIIEVESESGEKAPVGEVASQPNGGEGDKGQG